MIYPLGSRKQNNVARQSQYFFRMLCMLTTFISLVLQFGIIVLAVVLLFYIYHFWTLDYPLFVFHSM